MKSYLTIKIINKYILDKFGEIPEPPTKEDMMISIIKEKLSYEKVKLWHLFGGDLNIEDQYKRNILFSAVCSNQLNIVQYVFNFMKLEHLMSSYLCASIYGHTDIVHLFLNKNKEFKNININHQGDDGSSCLHITCNKNYLEIVKILVENGIDIYLKNNNDETALDIAKARGYQEIIDYLIPLYNNN